MKLPIKKCLVVIDTNLVYLSKEDRGCDFAPKDSFLSFLEWVDSNRIDDICLFAMPEIILSEISKQKFDENNSRRSKCIDHIKFFGAALEIPEQSFDEQYNKIKSFIETAGIVLLPHPSDFTKIINRAIHKKKPFTGQEGCSDKGMKDAVMLHSVLEIENLADFEKVFWLTKNSHDFAKEIEAEVGNLMIFNSEDTIEKFKRHITEHYSWKQRLTKYLDTNKDAVLAQLNDYGGDWFFTDFKFDPDTFQFKKEQNLVEFTLELIGKADFGGAGHTTEDTPITIVKLFDLSANEIIENNEEIIEGFPWEQELHDQVMAKKDKILEHVYKHKLIANSETMSLWPNDKVKIEIVNDSLQYDKNRNVVYFTLNLIYDNSSGTHVSVWEYTTFWLYNLDTNLMQYHMGVEQDKETEEENDE